MTNSSNWKIQEIQPPFDNYLHKETVFTIGNGYMSSRGNFEEGFPEETPTTFVNGVFNNVPLFGTELVNFPNPFTLEIWFENERFRLDQGNILSYERVLFLESGLLSRSVVWESPAGYQLQIQFERFMNMDQIHLAHTRISLRALNMGGDVQLRFPISGVVSNLNYRHWRLLSQGHFDPFGAFLALETDSTKIQAAISQTIVPDNSVNWQQNYWDAQWMPTLVFNARMTKGEPISLTRHVSIYSSREEEHPLSIALQASKDIVDAAFDDLMNDSKMIWDDLWSRSNIEIHGDPPADRALRYNLFQILLAAPRHDDRISIGAKTMSGYGYRGHVFWDTEIFILPFLIYTQPDIARNLLIYRYRTLPGAREKAKSKGYAGAMYAWESALTGKEVTPVWIPLEDGSFVRVWCGDLEQHISADIAYGILQYWRATGDDAFLVDFGAEVFLDVAKFYASRLEWDESSGDYHIRNVIGPDEYHEHVDDNAMTNLMARWVLKESQPLAEWLSDHAPEKYNDLTGKLDISLEKIVHWGRMGQLVWVNRLESGVIEQFKGFFKLDFVNQETLEPRSISLQQLYGIQNVQKYQFIKQPDVVMLLYLLESQFSSKEVISNLNYYQVRTDLTYGSSLGPSIQSLMLARYGRVEEAYALFLRTLMTDLDNNRGNTPDGIHAASAGGVWQVLVSGFMGLDETGDQPKIEPKLPEKWTRVRFKVIFRGRTILFDKF